MARVNKLQICSFLMMMALAFLTPRSLAATIIPGYSPADDRCLVTNTSDLYRAVADFNSGTNCFSGNSANEVAPIISINKDTATRGEEIRITLNRTIVLTGRNQGNTLTTSTGERVPMGLTITGERAATTIDARALFGPAAIKKNNKIPCVFDIQDSDSQYHRVAYLKILVLPGMSKYAFCKNGLPVTAINLAKYDSKTFSSVNVAVNETTADGSSGGSSGSGSGGSSDDDGTDGTDDHDTVTIDGQSCGVAAVTSLNRDGTVRVTVGVGASNVESVTVFVDGTEIDTIDCAETSCSGTVTSTLAAGSGTAVSVMAQTSGTGESATCSNIATYQAGSGAIVVNNTCTFGEADAEKDCDLDGVANGVDNCPAVPNPLDENGVQDGSVCQGSAAISDEDGDGLSDLEEDQLCFTNSALSDTDADGVNDYDECTNKLYPAVCALNADCDGDGICDGPVEIKDGKTGQLLCAGRKNSAGLIVGGDNCRIVENEDQADTFGVKDSEVALGIGDACEGDTDGDDICDAAADLLDGEGQLACSAYRDDKGNIVGGDNCPQIPNPDQADEDGDGRGDLCQSLPSFSSSSGGGCGLAATGTAAPAMQALAFLMATLGWAFTRRKY